MTNWNGTGDYPTRVQRILSKYFTPGKVLDDNTADTLVGGIGLDLFFAKLGGLQADEITDRASADKVTIRMVLLTPREFIGPFPWEGPSRR